jgi:hypothetical protein
MEAGDISELNETVNGMSSSKLHDVMENPNEHDPGLVEAARRELLKRALAQVQTEDKPSRLEPTQNHPPGAPVIGLLAVGLGLAGLFMPYFAAVFFVPVAIICGLVAYGTGQKSWGTAGILIGIIGLIWIFTVSNHITALLNYPRGDIALPSSIFDSPPTVTSDEYNQIQEGMSYQQVCSIIGASGAEISRTDIGGYSTVMYQWTNSNGSNMNAMFQNGELVSKAQFGLP